MSAEKPVAVSQDPLALPLPALNFLGYSINLSTTGSPTPTPVDVGSVSRSIIRTRRFIEPYEDNSHEIGIHGVLFNVPQTINIPTTTGTEQYFQTWTTGSQVNNSFRADHTLYSKFGAITGPISTIAPSYERVFLDMNQYGMFSHSSPLYTAIFAGNAIRLSEGLEPSLENVLKRLPTPFQANSTTTVEAYRSFFTTYGTHVITECQHGSRFQLLANAGNSDSAVNNRFNANIRAYFGGIMSQGNYEANIKSEAQYKRFEAMLQTHINMTGGDNQLAFEFIQNPNSYPRFMEWVNTTVLGSHAQAMSNSQVIKFGSIELWNLIRNSSYGDISSFADPLYDAFKYFTGHPQVFRTSVILKVVESNWGEFGLLTPGAICQINQNKGIEDPEKWMVSEDKVVWGNSSISASGKKDASGRANIEFWVINNGSPIDFWVSHGHGSNDKRAGSGRATVTFAGKSYVNERTTDNINKMEFYEAKVSSSPVYPKHTSRNSTPKATWNDVLKEYLKAERDGQFVGVNHEEEE